MKFTPFAPHRRGLQDRLGFTFGNQDTREPAFNTSEDDVNVFSVRLSQFFDIEGRWSSRTKESTSDLNPSRPHQST